MSIHLTADLGGSEIGPPALSLRDIDAGYGRVTVLRDVAMSVPTGSVVALLGPNGAGKTTTLRVAAGVVRPKSGAVEVNGTDVTGQPPHRRAALGVCLIPEGRGVFPDLSVRENLALFLPRNQSSEGVTVALDAFPVLAKRMRQAAGTLSGGEQQMLALARCFVAHPSVVLLDEVSMGLAPRTIDIVYEALRRLAGQDISMLLVEQYASRALEIADWVYVLDRGRIAHSGRPDLLSQEELSRRYFGGS